MLALIWDAFAIVGMIGTCFSFSVAAIVLVWAART